MTIQELKDFVEKRRANLEKQQGRIVMSSKKGPISISIIDAIVQTIEHQQEIINSIKEQVDAIVNKQ